jgi:hypothetical protein
MLRCKTALRAFDSHQAEKDAAMISISRSILVAAGLLALSMASASAQPPANDTVSKSTQKRPGEAASTPTGPAAAATTTKNTGDQVDSGPNASSGQTSGKQPGAHK